MAITNKEKIGRALDLLREGLYPFVEREMLSVHIKSYKEKGEFARIHIAPNSSADVPDDENLGIGLVILHPKYFHSSKSKDSNALEQVKEILDRRGASPRYCKNLLVFLSGDRTKLENLNNWVSQYLAWESIVEDKVVQHLTSLKNTKVKVTLEIEAEEEDGIPDSVIRTVSENCRTLKFKSQEFEE